MNYLCTSKYMLIVWYQYKHIKGGMYDSDTRCLNACLLTQFFFLLHITDKITLHVYVKKQKWVE